MLGSLRLCPSDDADMTVALEHRQQHVMYFGDVAVEPQVLEDVMLAQAITVRRCFVERSISHDPLTARASIDTRMNPRTASDPAREALRDLRSQSTSVLPRYASFAVKEIFPAIPVRITRRIRSAWYGSSILRTSRFGSGSAREAMLSLEPPLVPVRTGAAQNLQIVSCARLGIRLMDRARASHLA